MLFSPLTSYVTQAQKGGGDGEKIAEGKLPLPFPRDPSIGSYLIYDYCSVPTYISFMVQCLGLLELLDVLLCLEVLTDNSKQWKEIRLTGVSRVRKVIRQFCWLISFFFFFLV